MVMFYENKHSKPGTEQSHCCNSQSYNGSVMSPIHKFNWDWFTTWEKKNAWIIWEQDRIEDVGGPKPILVEGPWSSLPNQNVNKNWRARVLKKYTLTNFYKKNFLCRVGRALAEEEQWKILTNEVIRQLLMGHPGPCPMAP